MPADIDFPPTLPQKILLGYSDTPMSNKIASDMDTGATKERRRFTAVPRYITNARLYLSKVQKIAFRDFYSQYSAAEFNWIDPDDGSACICRLLGEPQFARIEPDRFEANFSFVVLP